MRERAQLLGGRFHIISAAGAGTQIKVRIPITGGQHKSV
jgi:signal transduction histidine kinase